MVKRILLTTILLSSAFTQLNAYNGRAAARYALKWTTELGDNHKKSYMYFKDADCTNFASQCMEAGGIRYDRIGHHPYQQWWSNWTEMPSESWRWAPTSRKRAYWGGFDNAVRIYRKKDMKLGDIIYFDWKGGNNRFTHTTIVTKIGYKWEFSWNGWYKKPKVYVTYHSTHRVNKDLDYLTSSKVSDRWECYRPGGL